MKKMEDFLPTEFEESQIAEEDINKAGEVIMELFISYPFWSL